MKGILNTLFDLNVVGHLNTSLKVWNILGEKEGRERVEEIFIVTMATHLSQLQAL